MAITLIKKRQIENLAIIDADVASGAAIASSKLADGANWIKKDGSVTFTADQSMGTHKLTNLATPTNPNDAARLIDVQNASSGLSPLTSVRAATTANITLSGAQTIDGVSIVGGDRVLVKNQSTPAQNGIYDANASTWTRSTDADNTGEITQGSYVLVNEGTTQINSGWIQTAPNPVVIGTDPQTWVQFSAASNLSFTDGLQKVGNVVSLTDLLPGIITGDVFNAYRADENGRILETFNYAYITAANRVTRETPSGTINGSNTVFTLAFTPTAGTEEVYLNGVLQDAGGLNDYTISGGTITFVVAPTPGDKIRVSYFK